MNEEKFRFMEHTADIKFQVHGKTLNEIFENSVLAVSNYLSGNEKVNARKSLTVNVSGHDAESLFCNFLDELLFLLDSENFIAARAEVTLRGNNLKAELHGDEASNYSLSHIKAATYAEMYMKKTANGWEAQAVLDV